jgi:hypothetical protein
MPKAYLTNADFADSLIIDILTRLSISHPVPTTLHFQEFYPDHYEFEESEMTSTFEELWRASIIWLLQEGYIHLSNAVSKASRRIFKDATLTAKGIEKLTELRQRFAPPPIETPKAANEPFNFMGFGIAETVGILTLFYVCCITSFNAGYLSKIPSDFITFFSLPDLLVSNIQIVQWLLGIFAIYGTATTLVWIINNIRTTIFRRAPLRNVGGLSRKLFALMYRDDNLLFAIFMLAIAVNILSGAFLSKAPFVLAIAPLTVFVIGLFSFWLYGIQESLLSLKSIAFWFFVNIAYYSYSIGQHWAQDDIIRSAGVHSVVLENGTCLDRKLIRAGGSGYPFYNSLLTQFEFRSKESVRTIFQSAGCT